MTVCASPHRREFIHLEKRPLIIESASQQVYFMIGESDLFIKMTPLLGQSGLSILLQVEFGKFVSIICFNQLRSQYPDFLGFPFDCLLGCPHAGREYS